MEISRRDMLKFGAGLAGVALVEGVLGHAVLGQELGKRGSVSRTTGGARVAVPSTCLMCPARCGILGFVEEGRLVKIEGNPSHPHNRGGVCAKGLAGVNQLYDPDRLLYPLRREGGRGEGHWRRITWEEALDELFRHLEAIRDRPQELAFIGGLMEGTGGLTGRLLGAFGTPNAFEEMALYQANKVGAHRLLWGAVGETPDVARSRFILNFGANPYESHPSFIPLVQRLVGARGRGASLVTFDPRLSNTASKSDEWFPLRPGTDGLVALAMARVLMEEGLGDEGFLRDWTNISPEDLRAYLFQFTIERAEEESGVLGRDIERIALELASTRPSTVLTGGGLHQNRHGVDNEMAVALLAAVAGIVEAPGGYCLPRFYPLPEPVPQPPAPAVEPQGTLVDFLLGLPSGQGKVGLLINYMANPVYSSPQPRSIQEVLGDEKLIPYHVAVDSYLTESALLADLLLPAATYLETWGLHSPPSLDLLPFVALSQPVIPPQGESRAWDGVVVELGERLGLREYLDFASPEAYLGAVARGIPGLDKAGGLDYLKENGVWWDEGARPTYRSYMKDGFATPSGRLELSLPEYSPPDGRGGELTLLTFQFSVHTYGRTANSMWLSEIAHRNPVWLHPDVARPLGISTGDLVRLTSPAGSVVARAWLTQGVHPEVAAMGACGGHWGMGRVAQAQRFVSPDPNTRLLWWGERGNGVHAHHLVPFSPDPVGGGPDWLAPVRIEKV